MADFIGCYGEFYRGSMAGLPQDYRRSTAGVWEFHCQSTAEVQRHYGPRSDKFIEILSQPLPSTLSKSTFPCGPSSIPGPSNFVVPGSCSLRQSRVRSPVGTLFQADTSSIPSFPQQDSSSSRVRVRSRHAPKLLHRCNNSAIIFP